MGDWHSAEQKRLNIVFGRGVAHLLKTEVFNFNNLIRAIGAVGSASHRHCGGHVFESRIAHHKGDKFSYLLYGFVISYEKRLLRVQRPL